MDCFRQRVHPDRSPEHLSFRFPVEVEIDDQYAATFGGGNPEVIVANDIFENFELTAFVACCV